jgi:hypothetical protein
MQRHDSTVGLDEKRAAVAGVLRLVPPGAGSNPTSPLEVGFRSRRRRLLVDRPSQLPVPFLNFWSGIPDSQQLVGQRVSAVNSVTILGCAVSVGSRGADAW